MLNFECWLKSIIHFVLYEKIDKINSKIKLFKCSQCLAICKFLKSTCKNYQNFKISLLILNLCVPVLQRAQDFTRFQVEFLSSNILCNRLICFSFQIVFFCSKTCLERMLYKFSIELQSEKFADQSITTMNLHLNHSWWSKH